MGGYYARHDGEPEAVAFAIEDHYKPRFAGDVLPRSDVGVVVALADKLETLVGMFAHRPDADRRQGSVCAAPTCTRRARYADGARLPSLGLSKVDRDCEPRSSAVIRPGSRRWSESMRRTTSSRRFATSSANAWRQRSRMTTSSRRSMRCSQPRRTSLAEVPRRIAAVTVVRRVARVGLTGGGQQAHHQHPAQECTRRHPHDVDASLFVGEGRARFACIDPNRWRPKPMHCSTSGDYHRVVARTGRAQGTGRCVLRPCDGQCRRPDTARQPPCAAVEPAPVDEPRGRSVAPRVLT